MGIKIETADVESMLKSAILESTIGAKIKEAVDVAMREYNLSRAIEEAVRQVVLQAAREAAFGSEELRAKIAAAVQRKLDDDFIDRLVSKISIGY